MPKVIKPHGYRVSLTPDAFAELTRRGVGVAVETGAGAGVGYSDEDHRGSGAEVLGDARSVFEDVELVIKVKEPRLHECAWLRAGQTLFTYLHLAADRAQALTSATLPYLFELMLHGVDRALKSSPRLAGGVNIARGQILHPAVAETLGLPCAA